MAFSASVARPAPRSGASVRTSARALGSAASRSVRPVKVLMAPSMRRARAARPMQASLVMEASAVDVETARALMEDGYVHVDVRAANVFMRDAYSKAINVPAVKVQGLGASATVQPLDNFLSNMRSTFPPGTKLLIVGDSDGSYTAQAVAQLQQAGYDAVEAAGGFPAWTKVFNPRGDFRDGRPGSAASASAPSAPVAPAAAPQAPSAAAPQAAAPDVPASSSSTVSPEAARALLEKGYVYVDVRPANVFARDAYARAVNIPAVKVRGMGATAQVEYLDMAPAIREKLKPGARAVVVGDTGGAYASAGVKALEAAGVPAVECAGGFPEWAKLFNPRGDFRDGRSGSTAVGTAAPAPAPFPAGSAAPAPVAAAVQPAGVERGAAVSPETARALMNRGYLYVDVRPANVFSRDAYAGAINIPVAKVIGFGASAKVEYANDFTTIARETLPKGSSVVVVGDGKGAFGADGVTMFTAAGYPAVKVAGGFPAWSEVLDPSGNFRDGRPGSSAVLNGPAAAAPAASPAPSPSSSAPAPTAAEAAAAAAAAAPGGAVTPAEGMALLQQQGYRYLDVRPANFFARDGYAKAINVPVCKIVGFDEAARVQYLDTFMAGVRDKVPSVSTPLLVGGEGDDSYTGKALGQLKSAGYSVTELSGGFKEWTKFYRPSGQPR